MITGSRGKALLLCLVGAGFAVIGLFMVSHPAKPDDTLAGVGCAAFFGLCAVVGLVMAVRPARLVIGDDAVLYAAALGREHAVRFADVQAFFVLSIRGSRQVAFRYHPGHRRSGLAQASRGLTGADGGFGGTWSLPAAEVVRRLNARLGVSAP